MSFDLIVGIVGVACTFLGLPIAYLAFRRERTNDMKNDSSESAIIKTKLDSIIAGVDIIRIDLKANEKRVTELSERIIRVEESSKQAHRRIDKIEGVHSNE